MRRIIIADTSCLIILSKIGELDILKQLYKTIFTTPTIAMEFGELLENWIEIIEICDPYKQQILETQIDAGEASAIALALDIPDSTLILDDNKARKIANRLGLKYTGTIDILIKAKNDGIIHSIKPILDKINNTNFRLAKEIEFIALKEANELDVK